MIMKRLSVDYQLIINGLSLYPILFNKIKNRMPSLLSKNEK